jgi:arginine decarboxylase
MDSIYVVRGVGTAATAMASYDAALAAANVHNYNLVRVSSVIPAEARVEAVEAAPDLGPAGNRLTVVEARATMAAGGAETVAAAIGWTTGPGPGLFYEAAGTDSAAVREQVERGLAAGRELREWTFDAEDVVVVAGDVASDPKTYTTAVALAVYGESEPIL